jgi:hypothetical protein
MGLLVVPHAPILVVNDALDRRTPRQDRKQLVDLLLILGKDVGGSRALERSDHLLGDGILVKRHCDGSQPVRPAHCRVETRSVVTHKRDVCAAPQPARGQRSRQRSRLLGQVAPGQGAPYAAMFFPNSRLLTALQPVAEQQLRKRIRV